MLELFQNFLFSYFYEEFQWNFNRDYTESVEYFGQYGHFNNTDFSNL
jgi:hypothetical protein